MSMDDSERTGGESPKAAPGQASDAAEPQDAAGQAEILATVEAVLFAADAPMTTTKIAAAAELPARIVGRAIKDLNARYEQAGAVFRIQPIAGGYQMLTLPGYEDVLSRLLRAKSDSKLSQAALETLAIVAYRQPIMRADIEAIRGVACGEVLRGLMEKNLVKIAGRAEVLGRPMLYGTTRRFLETFGLASLEDLPRMEELRTAPTRQAAKCEHPPGEGEQEAPPTEKADTPAEGAVDGGEPPGRIDNGTAAGRVADESLDDDDDDELDDDDDEFDDEEEAEDDEDSEDP